LIAAVSRTDLNAFNGTQTPEQGAAIAIRLATLPDDGPTGGLFDDTGIVPWGGSPTPEAAGESPGTGGNHSPVAQRRTFPVNAKWSPEELNSICSAVELHIAIRRPDGRLRRWTPIWVVCVDGQVYVRTWYRRETGWFGHALLSRRARIRVPGLADDVTVEDLGQGEVDLHASVDAAYRIKYGDHGSESMVTAAAAATTLRLASDR
jgi:hypothetical protein